MGVYCEVHICIEGDTQVPIDMRVEIVELARRHQLVQRHCAISVPDVMEPRGFIEHVKHLFGVRRMYMRTVHQGEPGDWIASEQRLLEAAPEVRVTSGFPMWKDEVLTGPFSYRTTRKARTVKTVNLYRSPEERSPYEPADGVIGEFYDEISITAKRGFDAKSAARSAFVRELKALTGTKVVCRSSWV
jgi:hypothetical protein